MIQALLLIFLPVATWERIFRARRGTLTILLLYVLPFLVLACAAEAYGLVHWGKYAGEIPRLKRYTVNEAIIFEAAQFLLFLVILLLGAKLVEAVGETFHGRHTYNQAFTAVAYGLGPLLLSRMLDAFPGISPWVSWPIGILLSMGVLYHGLPRIMEPDPPHAFGLYLMTSILLVLTTGLVRFVTAYYLQGKFVRLHSVVSDLAKRLPF
jgi:hypothetical protein